MAVDQPHQVMHAIFDPNPQLNGIEIGRASVLHWKDTAGRVWDGALVQPPSFDSGKRYPLVIQTHGFDKNKFLTYGAFPSAMAARELAGTGILVLQVGGTRDLEKFDDTPQEAPIQVAGYEAAVRKLTEDGLVDPSKVGIVGFSRTVFPVLRALTFSRVHFAAATICDGVHFGYMSYLLDPEKDSTSEAKAVIGAAPFGGGLKLWMQRAPDFNFDKVTTPLRIEASDVIGMWEPYAALRSLAKPVDLILLNTTEHPFTNPAIRLASQGGTLDWFHFWLQGYEDPDPAKADQYRRWEQLCDMQVEQNPKQPTFCVRSKAH